MVTKEQLEAQHEEIQILHAYLLERFGDYDIICACPGNFYHAKSNHNHEVPQEYIFIAYSARWIKQPYIALFEDSAKVRAFSWCDPTLIEELTSHIQYCIERYKIKPRMTYDK